MMKKFLKDNKKKILVTLFCIVSLIRIWLVYNTRKVPFFAYLFTRLFVQGQIYNSLFNYTLMFIAYPTFMSLKKHLK